MTTIPCTTTVENNNDVTCIDLNKYIKTQESKEEEDISLYDVNDPNSSVCDGGARLWTEIDEYNSNISNQKKIPRSFISPEKYLKTCMKSKN